MAVRRPAPAECPVCGEDVPRAARACPHCGADERSGWNEDETRYDGLDLPDESDAGENGSKSRRAALATFWRWVAVGLIVLLVCAALAIR